MGQPARRTRCARLSARTGLPIQPVVGVLAVAALDDVLDDALRAAPAGAGHSARRPELAGQLSHRRAPGGRELRRRLLDTLDVFGVEQALEAIRDGATRDQTRAVLRHLSCIDDVVDTIGSIGAQVHYRRVWTPSPSWKRWPSPTCGSTNSCLATTP